MILLLSGPPGTGKTTTAAILARRPGRPAVHLHADDLWGWVGTGRLLPTEPGSEALNATVTAAVAGAATAFDRDGFLVVVDCVFGPWRLGPFQALGVPLHYAVLDVPADLAVARCAVRTGDALRDGGVIRDLHRQFADLRGLERHRLRVAALGPEGAADLVDARLAAGALRL